MRNGGNAVTNEDLGRDSHWFDGDGMLSGVTFRSARDGTDRVQPEFVNQYILTDVYLSAISLPSLSTPILPSIATLVNPAVSLLYMVWRIMRTVFLAFLSFLPGSRQAIKKISVANTAIYYHDGRALATCESGPPMRVQLPGLETVGWYNGNQAAGEREEDKSDEPGFGGKGLMSFQKEWTTGHPKVDPLSSEMVLFHCTFIAPYVHYSVIPSTHGNATPSGTKRKVINAPVPKVSGGKMMHDFGVSSGHTIILDLPLTLDPLNMMKGQPVVTYDSTKPSRFGVFPRHDPSKAMWFETAACCIFHTANAWDERDSKGVVTSVNLLACRLTSAAVIFSAGNLVAPRVPQREEEVIVESKPMSFFDKYDSDYVAATSAVDMDEKTSLLADSKESSTQVHAYEVDLESPSIERPPMGIRRRSVAQHPFIEDEEDQCRLYLYTFDLPTHTNPEPTISRQYALSAIPFEFPTTHPQREMSKARYIYGCSTSDASFGAALGKAAKIDVLVKMDVKTLIARGDQRPPRSVTGCVDTRSMPEVLNSTDERDPVCAYRMPRGWYAQEARFVPRVSVATGDVEYNDEDEDEGYLLFYAFNEAQLGRDGEAPDTATSELWILNARNMREVVCRVKLPQRVPYGLHGNWFPQEQVEGQREVAEYRSTDAALTAGKKGLWMSLRRGLEKALA